MKPFIVNTIGVLSVLLIIVGVTLSGLESMKRKAEIQDLNRQLNEIRLDCNSQEMIEVLSQLLSPITMDELRVLTEKLKQQKLRIKIKRRGE